jgi:hypothetical protein
MMKNSFGLGRESATRHAGASLPWVFRGVLALALTSGALACAHRLETDDPGSGDDSPGIPGAGAGSQTPGSAGNGNGVVGNGGAHGLNPGGNGNSPGGNGPGSGGGSGGLGTTDPPPLSDCATPGPRMVRRLTAAQYRNTLVDIFQDPNVPAQDVLIDPAILGFHADADAALVQDLDAELLMNYAEQVAAWAAQNRLSSFTPCTNHDQNCRRLFIQNFGRRVHREALPEDRVALYEQIFAAEATFQAGAEVVVTAMLQSPYLLYRRELGQSDAANASVFALTPYEVASELSYFLTDTAPDSQLLDAAAQGRLNNASDIDREANRLIDSDKSRRTLAKFVEGWLEIDGLTLKAKDNALVQLTDSLRAGMLKETQELFFDTLFSNKGVSELLSANYTFVNRELAAVYQLGGAGSDSFQRVDLTGSTRPPGILGHGAFLTAHALPDNSSPVQRGKTIRERILCQDLPPVPQNLNTNLDPIAGFATNRERYKQHSADPVCQACHQVIDPVGFAFEHYDAFGRRREQEGGLPIDATGALTGMPEGEIPLNGVESLVSYLATSDTVRACLVRYWSYYAHGRDQWTQKECNQDSIRREAGQQNYSLKSVLMGILHAPHFTRRVKDQ